MNFKRPAGWALIVGTFVATFGYLAANLLAPGHGDQVFRYHLWPLFEGIAVGGDVIVALGLPVILAFAGRAPTLHLAGYTGVFAALVMLNIGEGVIEGFVKPYLIGHGRSPGAVLPGFAVFEGVALLALVVGAVCLGIAVLRARILPWWIGVALLASCLLGAAGLPGPWFLVSDGVFFAALFAIGVCAVRGGRELSPQGVAEPAIA